MIVCISCYVPFTDSRIFRIENRLILASKKRYIMRIYDGRYNAFPFLYGRDFNNA